MRTEEEILSKMHYIESMIRRLERKGKFYNSSLLKRDIHVLKWVLEGDDGH
jgi:hypothetical protein